MREERERERDRQTKNQRASVHISCNCAFVGPKLLVKNRTYHVRFCDSILLVKYNSLSGDVALRKDAEGTLRPHTT